jgi:hypothetical protein
LPQVRAVGLEQSLYYLRDEAQQGDVGHQQREEEEEEEGERQRR